MKKILKNLKILLKKINFRMVALYIFALVGVICLLLLLLSHVESTDPNALIFILKDFFGLNGGVYSGRDLGSHDSRLKLVLNSLENLFSTIFESCENIFTSIYTFMLITTKIILIYCKSFVGMCLNQVGNGITYLCKLVQSLFNYSMTELPSQIASTGKQMALITINKCSAIFKFVSNAFWIGFKIFVSKLSLNALICSTGLIGGLLLFILYKDEVLDILHISYTYICDIWVGYSVNERVGNFFSLVKTTTVNGLSIFIKGVYTGTVYVGYKGFIIIKDLGVSINNLIGFFFQLFQSGFENLGEYLHNMAIERQNNLLIEREMMIANQHSVLESSRARLDSLRIRNSELNFGSLQEFQRDTERRLGWTFHSRSDSPATITPSNYTSRAVSPSIQQNPVAGLLEE